MKKVLFATTALVATAGVAAADVAITGSAEMGIFDTSTGVNAVGGTRIVDTSNVQFHSDIDVTFTMSGETDGGVTFGGSVDLDEAESIDAATAAGRGKGPGETGDADFNVFVSGNWGTVTLGDTDGAMDFALTEVTGPGTLRDQETSHDGFLGSYLDGSEDGQIARYQYSFGDFTVAVSAEIQDTDANTAAGGQVTYANVSALNAAGTATAADDANAGTAGTQVASTAAFTNNGGNYAIGLQYGMDLAAGRLTLGLGMQEAEGRVVYASATTAATTTIRAADTTAVGVSASLAMNNGLTFGVRYTDYSDFAAITADVGAVSTGVLVDADHIGVGVSYTSGALTVGANWGELDVDRANDLDREGYAVTANYDLGGGAVIQAGYESSEGGGLNAASTAYASGYDRGSSWSLGLAMSF